MRGHRLRSLPLIAAMMFQAGAPAFSFAQTSATPVPAPTELGTASSIPTPDERTVDTRSYETSELEGTTAAVGSQLIDGRLRKPILDYGLKSPSSMQRISFFEGGLVAVHLNSGGARLRKLVLIPPGAVDEYLKLLPLRDLEPLATDNRGNVPLDDRGYIRMYRANGTPIQVVFNNSMVLDSRIQQLRSILDDLIRVLAEDRETTNPMVGYKPRIGDRLISEDQKLYEVTSIKNDGQYLELTCRQQSTRIYISTEKVYLYFHAIAGHGK